MPDYSPTHAEQGKPDDGGKAKPDALVQRYWREIERYDRAAENWHETGKRITRKYRDEDRAQKTVDKTSSGRRLQIFWANIETLKPAVYAKLPTLVASRRFKDEDPVGRVGGELLERAGNCLADLYRYDETFRMVRDDRLLPGRGQAWVRYEGDFEDAGETDDDGQPVMDDQGEPKTYSRLKALGDGDYETSAKAEKVCVDHVHWCDFGHNVARVWADVWLVWRKVYKTRAEVREKFGREVAQALTYNVKAPEDGEKETEHNKACLYEYWDKRRKRMGFLARQHPKLIDDGRPPLDLHGFFPCPEPAYGTKTADSLIPRPDYCYYQDQTEEIDDLTAKIGELTDWLIVKGFIPAGPSSEGVDAIERLLREKGKQILVPVESWAGFTERGGARGIDWLPLDVILQALQGAIESRGQLIQDVYQITGISDILRGQTDPDETLGAQELKAQTGSRRVRNTKDELARFARDVYRLVCEVIAENFDPQTLASMTGYKYVPGRVLGMQTPPHLALPAPPPPFSGGPAPQQGMGGAPAAGPAMGPPGLPPPPGGNVVPMQRPPMVATPAAAVPSTPPVPAGAAPGGGSPPLPEPDPLIFDDQVMERLRSDRIRSYSIDVETDSTIQPDEDAEKQRRVEFATMFGGFLKQAGELFQYGPMAAPLAPMIAEGLKFTVRGFRAGRQLEDAIDRAMDQLLAMIRQQASQPPKPSPEEMQAQLDAKKAEADVQARQQDAQLKMQTAQQDAQIKLQLAQFDMQMKQQEMQLKQQEMQMKLQFEQQKQQLEMQFKQQEMAQEAAANQQRLAIEQQSAAQELDLSRQRGEHEMAAAKDKHAADMKHADEKRQAVGKAEAAA